MMSTLALPVLTSVVFAFTVVEGICIGIRQARPTKKDILEAHRAMKRVHILADRMLFAMGLELVNCQCLFSAEKRGTNGALQRRERGANHRIIFKYTWQIGKR